MGDIDDTLLGEVVIVVFLLLICSLKRWNDLTRRNEDIILFGDVVGEDDEPMLLVIECGIEQVDDDVGLDRLLALELLLLFIIEAIDSLVRNRPFFLFCCNGASSSS